MLSHPFHNQSDAIELYNPNGAPVDLSGWYLTDNYNVPKKYRIVDGAVIPAYGYLVFYGATTFGVATASNSFGLSSDGESAYVFSGDSQTVVFQSWASDLAPLDFNQSGDVFALKLATSGTNQTFSSELVFLPAAGGLRGQCWLSA